MISVDVPSGTDADACGNQPGVRAPSDAIVTFTAPKPAHVFAASLTRGPVVVADIGSPPEAIRSALNLAVTVPQDLEKVLADRAPDAHKGEFGHVLVIAGSVGKAGAAAMAGLGALRAGAGLVTVACPRPVLPTVSGFAPELMTEPLEETESGSVSTRALDYGRLRAITEGKNVLAMGPGISRHTEAAAFVRAVVEKTETPLVLDADGLNAFEGQADKLDGRKRTLVLTPHPGEMARLTELSISQIQKDRTAIVRDFARQRHAIVVLKGHRTLIAEPSGMVFVNITGNPGMATGGTGDVLTGMIAGILAQAGAKYDEILAVRAAVYLHGLAGDIARETIGEHSLIATDLLSALPSAFRRARNWAGEQLVRVA